jgi:hypothetical protein
MSLHGDVAKYYGHFLTPGHVLSALAESRASLEEIISQTKRKFSEQEQARACFVKLTGLFKKKNYTRSDSAEYTNLIEKINDLIASVKKSN